MKQLFVTNEASTDRCENQKINSNFKCVGHSYVRTLGLKGTVRQMKPFNVNNDFTGCEIMFVMHNKIKCQLKWPIVWEPVELELELDGQVVLKKVGVMLTKGYIYLTKLSGSGEC